MDNHQKEFLISRIRAGYIPIVLRKKRILIYHANAHWTLRGNEVYNEAYQNAIEEELFSDLDVYDFLVARDLWSPKKEEELDKIVPGHIEYWKIELYNNILKSNTQQTIRKYLQVAKDELVHLHNIRHSFDYLTCAGYANYVKNMFLIANCARYKNKKVNWAIFDLNRAMNLYYTNMLSGDTIRMLARSVPWINIWPALKINGKIFDNNYLTIEQQTLISWSNMYDKIHEHPECPSDEVIEDNDLLDGWLLIQSKKRSDERKKQEVGKITNPKIKNANDIFIIAETPQDVAKIDLLNDSTGTRIKHQRLQEVDSKGTVLEQQFTDVKQRRAMEIRQAYSQKIKGN
ncbi:MAG: hypothetical protein KKH44_01315 [Bacteroidetes bacterium]|nr:hypothetical protein [Bacteroidota bacterium]